MGHLKSLFTLLFFFIITTSIAVTFAGKIPAVIVFGDSTVDAGNNNYIPTVARSNFEPYGRDFDGGKPTGRFCNGKIATDFMSEAIGLKPTIPAYLDPSYNISDFATGVTFASAATGYDNATSDVLVRTFLSLNYATILVTLRKSTRLYRHYLRNILCILSLKCLYKYMHTNYVNSDVYEEKK